MQRKLEPLFCERLCSSVFLCPCTWAPVAQASIPKKARSWDIFGHRIESNWSIPKKSSMWDCIPFLALMWDTLMDTSIPQHAVMWDTFEGLQKSSKRVQFE